MENAPRMRCGVCGVFFENILHILYHFSELQDPAHKSRWDQLKNNFVSFTDSSASNDGSASASTSSSASASVPAEEYAVDEKLNEYKEMVMDEKMPDPPLVEIFKMMDPYRVLLSAKLTNKLRACAKSALHKRRRLYLCIGEDATNLVEFSPFHHVLPETVNRNADNNADNSRPLRYLPAPGHANDTIVIESEHVFTKQFIDTLTEMMPNIEHFELNLGGRNCHKDIRFAARCVAQLLRQWADTLVTLAIREKYSSCETCRHRPLYRNNCQHLIYFTKFDDYDPHYYVNRLPALRNFTLELYAPKSHSWPELYFPDLLENLHSFSIYLETGGWTGYSTQSVSALNAIILNAPNLHSIAISDYVETLDGAALLHPELETRLVDCGLRPNRDIVVYQNWLRRLPSLRRLSFHVATYVNMSFFSAFAELLNSHPQVTHLDGTVETVGHISRKDFADIPPMQHILSLELDPDITETDPHTLLHQMQIARIFPALRELTLVCTTSCVGSPCTFCRKKVTRARKSKPTPHYDAKYDNVAMCMALCYAHYALQCTALERIRIKLIINEAEDYEACIMTRGEFNAYLKS